LLEGATDPQKLLSLEITHEALFRTSPLSGCKARNSSNCKFIFVIEKHLCRENFLFQIYGIVQKLKKKGSLLYTSVSFLKFNKFFRFGKELVWASPGFEPANPGRTSKGFLTIILK
jgi:hypothetical protein